MSPIPTKFKTHFEIRTSNRGPEFEAPIWIRVRIGRACGFRASTLLSIQLKYWDLKKERPKCYVGNNEILAKYLKRTDEKLSRIEYDIKYAISTRYEFTKADAESIILGIINEDVAPTGETHRHDVVEYCEYVIRQMTEGTRLLTTKDGKVKPYDAATIKSWRNFLTTLKAYAGKRHICWEDATAEDMSGFVLFLAKRELLPKTMNKYITTFKAMVTMAAKDKLVKDPTIGEELRKVYDNDSGKTRIYLTEAEIEALYNMPLEPGSEKERVRDIFCLGCYLCQRISDYNHLSREMFTTTESGLPILKFRQEKTGTIVCIPLEQLSPHIVEIAEKYDYRIPTVADQVLNRYIKQICKELSETVPSLADCVPTTLTARDKAKEAKSDIKWERTRDGKALVPRWDLVLSHTARRSGVTNLNLSGVLDNDDIRFISGHATEKNFEKYVLMGPELKAEKIARKLSHKEK